MKKQSILAFIIFCLFFNTNISKAAYPNTAITAYNSGVIAQRQGDCELAEQNYKRALNICPGFKEAQNNLKILYQNQSIKCYENGQYEKSLLLAQKAQILSPKDTNIYHLVAQSCTQLGNYDESIAIYKKILNINPNDKAAQNNLEYVKFEKADKNVQIPNSPILSYDCNPAKLYKLIKPSQNITPEQIQQMKSILDLIWSDPYGRILLQNMIDHKVRINITQAITIANAKQISKKHTYYLYGFIPVASFTTTSNEVNISPNYITNFYDETISKHNRLYNLQIFIHEFSHALVRTKCPNSQNSIEEEMGVSMLGYNISHKILTGEYLSKQETELYAKGCLISIMKDEHKDLPVFGSFNNAIKSSGIQMPYPETYSNLPYLYKTLLSENRVPFVPTFSEYVK